MVFMLNLATSDLLVCMVYVIEFILFSNESYKICQIFTYFEHCNIYSEWMSLAFISFIRCLTITNNKRWSNVLTKAKLSLIIFSIRAYGLSIIIFLSLDVSPTHEKIIKSDHITRSFVSGLRRISLLSFHTYKLFSNGNRIHVSDTHFDNNHQFGNYVAFYLENYKLCQGNWNRVI